MAKPSATEQHIQAKVREEYQKNKSAGDQNAFEYFGSETYVSKATRQGSNKVGKRSRAAAAAAADAASSSPDKPRKGDYERSLSKAPRLGRGTVKTSLIDDEDDED